MKRKKLIIRLGLIFAFSAILFGAIYLSWDLSSMTGCESNMISYKIAHHIEDITANYFDIDRGDLFWRETLNLILRKLAHFTEYVGIAAFLCIVLNLIFKRVWVAMLVSGGICPVLAYLDEYHQQYVVGRTPRSFDVKVDTSGAIIGIILVTIFFLVSNYIQKLRRKIKEFEESDR